MGKLVSNLSLSDQMSLAKEAGFDGIDYIATLKDILIKPHKVIAMSKDFGLPIRGLHTPLPLVYFTPPFLYQRLFNMIANFPDCRIFNVHLSGIIHPFQKKTKTVKKFITLFGKSGIDISFESNPNGYYFLKYYPKETYNPEQFAQYCVKHNLPMNFDTSHIASFDYDIVLFFKKYYKYINLIHLSDYASSVQHLPLGEGKLPLEKLFYEMKRVSYNKTLIFEIFKFRDNMSFLEKQLQLKKGIRFLKNIYE